MYSKRHILSSCIALCLLTIAFTGCSATAKTHDSGASSNCNDDKKALSQSTEESPFVGEWFCSRSDSCNDMEITLTIEQADDTLYFKRRMVSENSVGDSFLQGDSKISGATTISADYISGSYRLSDNILYEVFDNGRENKYIRIFEQANNEYALLNKEWSNVEELIENLNAVLCYWNDSDFSSIEDIHKYELMWQELSEDAIRIQEALSNNSEWSSLNECIGNLATLFTTCTDLDTDGDGCYTGAEMALRISDTRDQLVICFNEAQRYYENAKVLIEGTESIDTKSEIYEETKTDTENDLSNENYCEECSEKGTHSYIGLSGEKEWYCTYHYNEIMDILDKFESDVGNGTASKHICEECSNEGTYSYIGISGKKEWYCTKHYNELQDLLASFGLN